MDRQPRTKIFFSRVMIVTCFTMWVCNAMAQNTQDSISNLLYGTWFLKPSTPITADTLTFKKVSFYPMVWGPRIEIAQDGKFTDADSEKCGNDKSIHLNKGNWLFSVQTMQLETTIDIDKLRGNKFRVVSVDVNELTLLRTP